MEYVIIKLYVNMLQDDFHDLYIEKFESILKEMQSYAQLKNRKLFFAPLANDLCVGIPVDCTPFAEIEYTGSLSEEERKAYIEYMRDFSTNGELYEDGMEVSITLAMVKFKKIEDEIFEIS